MDDTTPDTQMQDYELMDASELGKLLGRATSSIQVAVSKFPDTLPPRFIVPGTRLVRWKKKDVRDWMDAMAQIEIDKRKREAEFAARYPPGKRDRDDSSRGFFIAHTARGRAATARQKENK